MWLATEMSENVLTEEQPASGVLLVRLNRPDHLNALSGPLMDRLEELWRAVAGRPEIRCVVLTGNGRGFCSGADTEFLSVDRAPRGDGIDGELSFLPGRTLDIPVIVAVNGVCAGGGLHFVADADFVIAARRATFLDPHVRVGQVSGIEPPSLILRLPVPVIARMALLGTAERLTAQRLYELGLVTEIVDTTEDPESLVARAIELATAVAAASPAAVRATRRSLRRHADAIDEPYMAAGWDDVQAHWSHPDSVEGPQAFVEKREPRWTP